MCANNRSTPPITTLAHAAVLLSLSLITAGAGSTAHASHRYVSDLSLDWAVVASHGIVEAEVAELNDPEITYRVTAILKQTDAPLVEIGSLLEDGRHFSSEQKLGDKTVLFFFAEETTVHAAINVSRPRGEVGLAMDRDCKPILTPEDLLARIRRLVDDGRKENGGRKARVCQEGVVAVFEAGVDPDYGDVLYRKVLVPPQSSAERAAALDPREVFNQSTALDLAQDDSPHLARPVLVLSRRSVSLTEPGQSRRGLGDRPDRLAYRFGRMCIHKVPELGTEQGVLHPRLRSPIETTPL